MSTQKNLSIIKIMTDKTKKRITVQGILTVLVIANITRQIWTANYENVFVGVLTLILFGIPFFIDRRLNINIPPVMTTLILCFIFAAEILGEINSFYTRIPYWDTMLHTTNGFLMAAVGFSLVDLINRSEKFSIKLSPLFLAVVAFCFSMTIGVLWEFFEFSMDSFLGTDMQKDFIVSQINSVKLNPDGLNIVERIKVDSLLVNGDDWMSKLGGYLDIGIIDTMKDLFVNFIGAVVFSVFGYFYVKHRGAEPFIEKFSLTYKSSDARPDV